MKKFAVMAGVFAVVLAAGFYISPRLFVGEGSHEGHKTKPESPEEGILYQCPMHPQIVSKTPGDCPICHMRLEKVEREKGEAVRGEGEGERGGDGARNSESSPPGHAEFVLSEARQRLIGVKTVKVEMRNIVLTVPSPGKVLDIQGLVSAEVFEFEAFRVSKGQEAAVLSSEYPGRALRARVETVMKGTDPATRTLTVHLRLRKDEKKPSVGTLVEVRIQTSQGRALAIPLDAYLNSGELKIAFVRHGGGHFEPRSLVLGREGDSDVEILSGLVEGEEVVTGANFLMDSESRFRAAGEEYGKHAH